MSLKDQPFLFLDCQTTGMRPSMGGHLLEIAWALASAEELAVTPASYLVRLPEGASIPARVTEITGIEEGDLTQAVDETEVFAQLSQFCDQQATLIHYAQFEKPFLLDLFARLAGRADLPLDIMCTHGLAKRLFPALPSQNIRGATGYFGHSVGPVKRAGAHVHATHQIWRGLVERLSEQNIYDWEALKAWRLTKPTKQKPRYEYRIDRSKRLNLPQQPGIYRMLSKAGEVLYVGKATSLKSRVNSYFRGYSGRDRRKLEMLAQVWDLEITACRTPLEAALMESDEIKRLNPPYNVVMKRGQRHIVFYSRDFSRLAKQQDASHPIGPFRSSNWIDHLRLLEISLLSGQFEQIFWEPVDPEILREGFRLFLAAHGLSHIPDEEWTIRRLLAYGLALYRNYVEPEEPDEEEQDEHIEGTNEEVDYTPEEIAEKFERLLRRAGHEYWSTRELTELLNAKVTMSLPDTNDEYVLEFAAGRLGAASISRPAYPWKDLDIDTFDRMNVLKSELARYDHKVTPRFSP